MTMTQSQNTTAKEISLWESLSIATSSSAPLYSVIITSILMFPLVGTLGVPLVYMLAAIPSLLVCYSMIVNNTHLTSKGSVYSWTGKGIISWLSGYSLMATGIICTAGLAVYASVVLLPGQSITMQAFLSAIIVALGVLINTISIRATTWVQNAGLLVQIIALGYIAYYFINNTSITWSINGDIVDWSHAFVLALFAYWGFDAVFALSEESKKGVPNKTSMISIVIILIFYIFASLLSPSVYDEIIANDFIRIAIAISSITAIGSTLIPTVRGIESMSDNGEFFKVFSHRIPTSIFVSLATFAWIIVSLINEGFFWDSIEALSIMVGFYFTMSCIAAYRFTSDKIHLISAIIMGVLTTVVFIYMFTPGYGETTVGNIGGVGIIVIALFIVGAILAAFFTRKEPMSEVQVVLA